MALIDDGGEKVADNARIHRGEPESLSLLTAGRPAIPRVGREYLNLVNHVVIHHVGPVVQAGASGVIGGGVEILRIDELRGLRMGLGGKCGSGYECCDATDV